jgi:hypothetical protein
VECEVTDEGEHTLAKDGWEWAEWEVEEGEGAVERR